MRLLSWADIAQTNKKINPNSSFCCIVELQCAKIKMVKQFRILFTVEIYRLYNIFISNRHWFKLNYSRDQNGKGLWLAIYDLISNQLKQCWNWKDQIGVRESLGCFLVLVAGTKLYISMIQIHVTCIIK